MVVLRSVNLPRWGLKHRKQSEAYYFNHSCKFTPLGFETVSEVFKNSKISCVNLPRWGLKRDNFAVKVFYTLV